MDKAKTFFETWMENQSKLANTWTSMGEKFQNPFLGGQSIEKGTELYNDWLKKQNELLSFWTNTNGSPKNEESNNTNGNGATEAKTPMDYYKNWFEGQMNTTKNWMDNLQNTIKAQTNPFQQAYSFNNSNPFNLNGGNIQDNLMSNFKTWSNSLNSLFSQASNGIGNGTSKEAFENFIKGNEVYQKMYEIWMPLYKSWQEKTFTADSFSKMVDPTAYKSLMDKMFGFDGAEKMKDFFTQSANAYKSFHDNAQKAGQQFSNMFGNESNLFTNLLPVDQQAFYQFYNNLYSQVRNSVSPLFKLAESGKEKELAELTMELVDKLALYQMKGAALQYHIYTAGNKAMDTIGKDLQKKYADGQEFSSFLAFYQEWTSTSEKVYTDLFNTDEFSALQAELIGLDIEIRGAQDKLAEMSLGKLPIVLRKDMDEVYETNYELRKRVRTLEKAVKALEAKLGQTAPATEEAAETENKARKIAALPPKPKSKNHENQY